ncbi:MAG TPA: hypothetical protein VEH52_07060 [Gaiellaceae bacterium]|nr:hypothetical protein [Gaiellaceae bacterium]
MTTLVDIPLAGAGGEPVDFARTIASHGVVELPPNRLDFAAHALETTLAVDGGARTLRLSRNDDHARIALVAGQADTAMRRELARVVRYMLRLDEDLSDFYELCTADPDLDWCASGAGRMLRSPTVFEDVVKTILTTNTAWSGTTKMATALVDHLGAEAPGGGRAFPTPAAMAGVEETFYRETVRAGYRAAYLVRLATDVADGTVELETLADPELSDDDVAARLLALPGVGPYAAAHVMLISLGRYSRLVLDSWTRPTYSRLVGAKRQLKDTTIERRFGRYGRWAGLAFWLYVTRSWVDGDAGTDTS